jgi:hypothetical protein
LVPKQLEAAPSWYLHVEEHDVEVSGVFRDDRRCLDIDEEHP